MRELPTEPPYVINAPSLSYFKKLAGGVRFTVKGNQPRDENGKVRTELRLKDPKKKGRMFLVDPDGSEMWSAREFMLDGGWDVSFPHKIVISQWHHDGGSDKGSMPPLQVFMWRKNLYIRECHGTYKDMYKGELRRGVWHRLVTHVRWDSSGREGMLDMWLDGVMVACTHGVTMGYKAAPGVYESVGLYAPEPGVGLNHSLVCRLWERGKEAMKP